MKFTSTHENLNRGLALIGNATARNVTLPILNNTLLRVEGGLMEVLVTNLEISVRTVIRGHVDEVGSVTVPTRVFSDYVSLLPDAGNIQITSTENDLTIVAGGQKSVIKGLSANDFPILPTVEPTTRFTLSIEKFEQLFSRVLFSVSQDTTRAELCGVFLKKEGGTLFCVATDGFRLAESTLPAPDGVGDFSVIIPLKALQETLRICGFYSKETTISVAFDENQVEFSIETTSLFSRLIEGKYPEYKQIIPEKFSFVAVVDTATLLHAVRLNGIFTKKGTNDVLFDFIASDKLKISSSNIQVGENTTEVSVDGALPEKVVFNYKYILEGLGVFDSKGDIHIHILTSNGPMLLTSPKKEGFLYLVMPIRQ